jgi:hypothetical protein
MHFGIGFIILMVWSIAWKGWALWLAARRGEKWWFVALLVFSTLGILEIIYIFLVAKRSDKSEGSRVSSPAAPNRQSDESESVRTPASE